MLTDIITFDETVGADLCANIAISVTRVRENAAEHNVAFEEELLRVMSHGFFALFGLQRQNKNRTAIGVAAITDAAAILPIHY